MDRNGKNTSDYLAQCSARHRNLRKSSWKCCELMSTKGDQGVLETYLLARLLPNIRQNACAKVFKDACLKPEKSRIKAAAFAAVLDELIKQALNDPMTDAEFWTQTNDFLGPGDQCEEIKSLYQEMSNELFPLASECVHLDTSVLFEGVLTRWNKWMLKIAKSCCVNLCVRIVIMLRVKKVVMINIYRHRNM